MVQHLNYKIIPSQTPLAVPSTLQVSVGRLLKSVLSWLFQRLAKRRIKKIADGALEIKWRLLNSRLSEPLAIPYLMVNAPRWNTHASVLTAGPFVHAGGEVHFEGLPTDTCKSWALVFYDAVNGETKEFLSSGSSQTDVSLDKGIYGCGLRIYEHDGPIEVPSVYSKNSDLIPQFSFSPSSVEGLQDQVFDKSSRFFRTLNAPTTTMLAMVKAAQNDRLAKAFLPVGNPETLFVFGPLPSGHKTTVDVSGLKRSCLCYLTTYNSASFPTGSTVIRPNKIEVIPTSNETRSFLIRIIPKVGSAAENTNLLDAVSVVSTLLSD